MRSISPSIGRFDPGFAGAVRLGDVVTTTRLKFDPRSWSLDPHRDTRGIQRFIRIRIRRLDRREDHRDWVLHAQVVDSKSSRPVGGAQIEIEFNNIDDPSNNRPFRDRFRKKPTRDATDERGRFDLTIKNYHEDPLSSIDISVEHPDFISYREYVENHWKNDTDFPGLIEDLLNRLTEVQQ
jgi:hypothetical protein